MADIEKLLEERGAIYGDAVRTHENIATVWSGILGQEVTAHQVALCMIGLKLVRAAGSPSHLDSLDDAQGYAKIGNKIAQEHKL